MEDYGIILENQMLMRVFNDKLWESAFSEEKLEASKSLLNLVSNIEIYDYDANVAIEADVKGLSRRVHYTEANFIMDESGLSISCECNCNARGNCKHLAAMLYHVGRRIQNVSRVSRLGLDEDVSAWLVGIEAAENVSNKLVEKKTKKNAFLAYCLKWDSSSKDCPELVIHKGKLLKKGTFIDSFDTPAADPLKPSSFMDEADSLPCMLIFPEKDKYTGEINLSGEKGYDILQAILKTERVYHLPEDELEMNCPANPVREGEELKVKPTWKVNSDGSRSPSLGLPKQSFLLPSDPACALVISDIESEPSRIHRLDAGDKSADFLHRWHNGPTIPAEKAHKLANAFSKLKLDESLPSPPKTKSKKIAKKKPITRLHLYRANPFIHGGLHLSGKPEPIIAELSFDYNGGCILEPDLREKPPARAKFTCLKGDDLLEITRDTKAEIKSTMMLVEGTCLIPSLMTDSRVQPKYYSSFLPRTAPETWDAATADFITNAVPLLEKMDWRVTIDESAKLEITLVDDDSLKADLIEDPDHGIDWFQFAASYTSEDGEKHSLIPFIGEVLQQVPVDKIDEMINSIAPEERIVIRHPETGELVSFPWLPLLHLAKNIIALFGERSLDQSLHKIEAAGIADALEIDSSDTMKALAKLGNNLKNIDTLAKPKAPKPASAKLRDYQLDGFHWMQFMARHGLNGILADDMGLGKTLQALTHIKSEIDQNHTDKPSLVVAPTSVVGNWAREAAKFYPDLTVLVLHGLERKTKFDQITKHQLVLTTYPLIVRDYDILKEIDFHLIVLDEAQYIKNHVTKASQNVCKLKANHKLSLSGTPLENHLGELWSQMRFLMPGILGSQKKFTQTFRTPIEKHKDTVAQQTLNGRVAPLVLRRTKDKVAKELPKKTTIIQTIPLNKEQIGLYETVRASMDVRVKEAIADKGLAKSQIIVLDALLKLRQICCHPQLLKIEAAKKVESSAKLDYLTTELLPQLISEGRKILLFSSFTSMLSIIEKHIKSLKIPYSKITGATQKRQQQIDQFQEGETQIFLISLKAGGTGLNLTAADTVIHYDPWWNPAAENQATDRAHRIGQDKPVFVHKLISEGSIEQKIQELQAQKSALLDALLTEETSKLKIDQETLSNLLEPI